MKLSGNLTVGIPRWFKQISQPN